MKTPTRLSHNQEKLKNALLSLALFHVNASNPNYIPSSNDDYNSFDGTELPTGAGWNVTNACFTYITNSMNDNSCMASKQVAIKKYLNKNLATEEQIIDFFEKFVEIISKGKKEK